MIRGLFLVLVSVGLCLADSDLLFMDGKTWLFTDDRNRNIGTTMADVRANTVIMVSLQNGELSGAWANLTGLSFLSVGAAVKEIVKQFDAPGHTFSSNTEGSPDEGHIWHYSETTSNPEAYNCNQVARTLLDNLSNVFRGVTISGRTIEGKAVSYDRIPSDDVWFVEPPDCVLEASIGNIFPAIQDVDLVGYCRELTDGRKLCRHNSPESVVGNDQEQVSIIADTWCDMSTNICQYEIPDEDMKTEAKGDVTWNIQLFPRIVWHPRNILDGQPIRSEWLVHYDPVTRKDFIKNNEKDALFMIEKSRNSSDPSIKGWRDPVLSDSLSALLSFQFRGSDVHDSVVILRDEVNGLWDRSPWRGALVANYTASPYNVRNYDIGQALLRIFADSDREIEVAANVNERCGSSWPIYDEILGQQVFEFQDTTINNEFVPACTDDTPYGQPCAKENLAYAVSVKRIKFRTDVDALDPSLAIWRDGCPDPRPARGLYKAVNGRRVYQNRGETLRWLQETPPRCSLKLLDRLFVIYDGLFQYYKNDQDKTLAKAAWAKAGFAQTWIKRIKDWKAKDAKAVEEWDHCETANWSIYGWDR